MGIKYKNLKGQICSWENILLAYQKASNGKKSTRSFLEFKEYDLVNLKNIQTELLTETYIMDESYDFTIFVPKERNIKALSFRDRIVQHAINNIIEPIFEKVFLPFTYACRKDKGTHKAVKYAQSIMRKSNKPLYYLKTDYRKYFKSVQFNILHKIIKKKISCIFTLNIIYHIFPKDKSELPVGWLLSQLFGNVYGSIVDHYIHHNLKQRNWTRYMDDIAIFNTNPNKLKEISNQLKIFSKDALLLEFSKCYINSTLIGLNFLGYRIWKSYKLIRKDSVNRAKLKLHKYTKLKLLKELKCFIGSWNGHVQWADCHNLKITLGIYQ